MSRIDVDPERLDDNAAQLEEVVELTRTALSTFPDSVDGGEGSEPIADVISRIMSMLEPFGSSYMMIARILRDVAAETITNEETTAAELQKIADAVGPV
ncbi:hypothetical protein [Microbacterium sp. WCS2018Hpa-23]|uniref:hypothetical protein n=1 Tax=Microbacterium sp. WCS2018Hpa-23 TaxID=3073634 RepID=UPI002882DB8E|nr:hypothetical protein [Microbacterium sp. WCS2018Hpa-23]